MIYSYPNFNGDEIPQLELRQKLIGTYKRLIVSGLNRGISGNCSVRIESRQQFLITPSGVPLERMTPASIVEMDTEGNVLGVGRPSSEWRFHCDLFKQRLEVNAVVHTHSLAATALACLRRGIPAFHYMIAVAGGDSVRCANYELFGTQALSDEVIKAIEERKACLLANHGLITVGKDLNEAFQIAIEVETLADQYLRACQLGEPEILDGQQMADVTERFKSYGYQSNHNEMKG